MKPRVAAINENGKQDTRPIKYTREFVLGELKSMLFQAQNNKDTFLLGDLFESRDYHMNRFSEWASKWSDDREISGTIGRLKSLFEYRLNKKGLLGELNPHLTALNLKHNYKWTDKSELEHTGSVSIFTSIPEPKKP